jgi:sterol desaturase/sphingolipid hydroxylase (fatty acid hydroxylase superfamily)
MTMTPPLGPFLLEDLTFNGGLYALFVIPAFFLCWVVFPRALAHRRIQPKQRATSGSILRDFGWSLSSLLVFAVMDFGIVTLERLGIAKSTDVPVEQYGLLALVLSVPALIVLHDAYFYWMHRAVHAPWLFRLVHQVHHRSTDPSPFTSFAFHPLEAVLEHAFALIVVLLFPVHFWALIAWQVFQQFFNMVGHLGYEVYPRWWLAAPLLRLKTTSTHHNLHHEKFRGNYGLYFVWWDRWMGTEFADYEQRFLASTAPKALPATSEAVP